MNRNRKLLAATAVAILLSLNNPSSAQLAVFDPTNYAQNVMTAANTLRQINNQITSLQNEAQMLINEGKISQISPTPRCKASNNRSARPSDC